MKGTEAIAAVVERLVAQIEAGVDRWQMPWRNDGLGGALPHNATTGVEYRGGNVIACWLEGIDKAYPSQQWATYKQWAAAGAQVRKGEHSLTLIYWDQVTRTDPNDEDSTFTRMVPRAFHVFNAAQVDGWNVEPLPVATRPRTLIDEWVASVPFRMQLGKPSYHPILDVVCMPPDTSFDSIDEYHATLMHELTHWTGHTSRLSRQYGKRFGDQAYAMEELVAELGAAFLCHGFGITPAERADHASYLANWCAALRAEPTILWSVASKAQAAADYLHAFHDQQVLLADQATGVTS